MNRVSNRLESLDILRGFDLFCLVFFQPVLSSLARASDNDLLNTIMTQFRHVQWEGFVFWDLIMPLFMFMAGVSMPFAFNKHLAEGSRNLLYKRIFRRVLLLWIFGMICQGNLLALDFSKIYLYSNTLQAIAMGYLISAILLINLGIRGQLIFTVALLMGYWGIMTFVGADGYGKGDFTPDRNFAEYIDRTILGRFRDGVKVTDGGLDFGNYRYTWLLSSLNFGVTVMTGVFAGHILRSSQITKVNKAVWLLGFGVLQIVLGVLWGVQIPIIKKIWTSSMTLYSSGICFILMALFYYVIDYLGKGKYFAWLKIYGMNSILAYIIFSIIDFNSIIHSLFFGLEQFLGNGYQPFVRLCSVSLIFVILYFLAKKRIYLKV
ncbi:acyltransferase family protein [Parapedobacter pyrenivorans]|uniref:acyltransferase family protein n=1 Tax=Parapedobacter pyrenivorans TaxID=1305674 RepID=UPI00333FA5F9